MTAAERKVYDGLKNRKHNSYLGWALDNFRANPTEEHFEKLVKELRESGQTDIVVLRDILGDELANNLMALPVSAV